MRLEIPGVSETYLCTGSSAGVGAHLSPGPTLYTETHLRWRSAADVSRPEPLALRLQSVALNRMDPRYPQKPGTNQSP